MAVTQFQSEILTTLAAKRRADGVSYVAGGVALNLLLETPRLSQDIDLFHDTEKAVVNSWRNDHELLLKEGYCVKVVREAVAFVEAQVTRNNEHTLLQWVRDSAFRFFPLLEHPLMGLTLHPFDLATNKVLAMAGRLEVRDWVDLLQVHNLYQPLGILVWAACGKDPGYNPQSLLAAMARHHYSQAEVDTLSFQEVPPSAAKFGEQWHRALAEARDIVSLLPTATVGKCPVTLSKKLFIGSVAELRDLVQQQAVIYHQGSIYGAWPVIKTE